MYRQIPQPCFAPNEFARLGADLPRSRHTADAVDAAVRTIQSVLWRATTWEEAAQLLGQETPNATTEVTRTVLSRAAGMAGTRARAAGSPRPVPAVATAGVPGPARPVGHDNTATTVLPLYTGQ
jgi:hypothetical protein